MGKKGLLGISLLSLFISVLSLLLILSALSLSMTAVFADQVCYDSTLGVCTNQLGSGQCPGTTTQSSVAACQPTGCCCYKDSASSSGFSSQQLVSSAVCSPSNSLFAGKTSVSWSPFTSTVNDCATLCSQSASGAGSSTSGTTTTGTSTGTTGGATGASNSNSGSNANTYTFTPSSCTAIVTGSVQPASQIPASLLVYAQVGGSSPQPWGVVAADGSFRLTAVCPGSNTISISDSSNSYTATPQTVSVATPSSEVDNVVLQLTPKNLGQINGKVVVTGTTQAISGALVRISGTPFATYSNSDGTFSLSIPNAQTTSGTNPSYTLMTTKDQYLSSQATATLTASSGSSSSSTTLSATVQINMTSSNCFSTLPVPTGLTAQHTQGQSKITLGWQMPSCSDVVTQYFVQRCTGLSTGTSPACSNDANFVNIATVLSSAIVVSATGGAGAGTASFVDSNTQWGTNYTYRVVAEYPGPQDKTSAVLTAVYSGDAVCANIATTTPFCGTTQIPKSGTGTSTIFQTIDVAQYCDANNKLTINEQCTPGVKPLCVQRVNGDGIFTASCIAPDPCGTSSSVNPFGLYFTAASCQNQAGSGVCYFDKNLSNVNSCLNCQVGMTCTSYKTQQACASAASSCGTSSCAWNTIDPVLGIGVCANTQVAQCGDCSDPTKAPLGVCNSQTCAALGTPTNGCFYTQSSTCQQCAATSCGDYTTQNSCEGSAHAVPTISFTDNSFVTKSADSCGIGFCEWQTSATNANGGTCVKDANGPLITPRNNDDCIDSTDPAKCNLDRTPPTTFIVMPDTSNPYKTNVTIRFIAQDTGASGANQVYNTRFCITPLASASTNCMNTQTDFSVVPNYGVQGRFLNLSNGPLAASAVTTSNFQAPAFGPLAFSDGIYVLRYYSVDNAFNVEQVKSKTFTINTTAPVISIETDIFANNSQTNPHSDIVAVVNSNVPVKCQVTFDLRANLNSIPDPISSPVYSTSLQTLFQNKVDGVYGIKATCSDINGNSQVAIADVLLGADNRMQNINPTGIIGTNSPLVSFQTAQPVQCRMTSDPSKLTAFNTMESIFTSQYNPTIQKYNQTLQLTNLPEGNNTPYYIACNFNSQSLYVLSLFVDTQVPTIQFENPDQTPFDFSKWYTAPAVYARCTTPGTLGTLGNTCTGYSYCVQPISFSTPLNNQPQCTPNIVVSNAQLSSGRGLLTFSADDYSSEICVQGTQLIGSQIRNGSISCNPILIDKVAPSISIGSLPSVTNKNTVSVSGVATDPTAKYSAINLQFANGQSSGLLASGKLNATNVSINGTILFTFDASSPSFVDIIVRDNSTAPVTVRIDATNPSNVLLKLISSGAVLSSATIPSASLTSGQISTWSVVANGTTINASVGATSVVGTVSSKASGDIKFITVNQATTNGGQARVSLGSIQYYDLDLAAIAPLQLLTVLNDGNTPLNPSTNLPTIGSFNNIVTLDPSDSIVEGRSYVLTIYARDVAGQQSAVTTKNIQFSVAGPAITDVSFTPNNASQSDKSYIEYGQNATVLVSATAQYGLASGFAAVTYADQSMNESVDSIVSAGLQNTTFSTAGLPVGILDVIVGATDVPGTPQAKTFMKKLYIRNTQDPLHNISIADEIITNDSRPTLTATVFDDYTIACSVKYPTQAGIAASAATGIQSPLKTDAMTAPDALTRQAKLSQDLPFTNGTIVESQATLTCSMPSAPSVTWSHSIWIIVDKRPPVIGASLMPAIGMSLDSYTRTVKNYVAFTPTDKTLSVISDEPVSCRYGPVSSTQQPNNPVQFFNSLSNVISDSNGQPLVGQALQPMTATISTSDGATGTGASATPQIIGVSCMDIAGNIAGTARFVSISTDSTAAPHIISANPQDFVYPGNNTFQVTTTTAASCSVRLGQGAAVQLQQGGSDSSGYFENAIITLPLDPDNFTASPTAYTYSLTCSGANGKNVSKNITVSLADYGLRPTIMFTDFNSQVLPAQINTVSPLLNLNVSSNKRVTVMIMNDVTGITLFKQVIPAGVSSLMVPVPMGITPIQFSASDDSGMGTGVQTVIERSYSADAYTTQFSDALANSAGPQPMYVLAQLTSEQIGSQSSSSFALPQNAVVSATIVSTDSNISSSILTPPKPIALTTQQISTANGANLNITLPQSLSDGNYYLQYAVSVNNIVVAADGAVFTIDSLSEPLLLSTTPTLNQTQQLVTGSQAIQFVVPYKNLITVDESSWDNNIGVINRTFENATSSLARSALPEPHIFNYAATNELGHISSKDIPITMDVAVPSLTFSLTTAANGGANAQTTSISPVPRFLVTSSKPARLANAVLRSTTAGQQYSVALLSLPDANAFATSFDIRATDRLPNGQYTLVLTAVDAAGNVAANEQFSFTITVNKLQVTLLTPKFGLTSTNTMALSIGTDRPAACSFALLGSDKALSFSTMDVLSTTDEFAHNGSISFATAQNDQKYPYIVSCIEDGANASSAVNATFYLGKSTTVPQITSLSLLNSVNNVVSDPLGRATLSVSTSIPAVCSYGPSATTPYSQMTQFTSSNNLSASNVQTIPNLVDGQSYTYSVICDNGAGILSSPSTISFTVNMRQNSLITIKTPSNGGAYVNPTLPVAFQLVRPAAQGCFWSKNASGLSASAASNGAIPTNLLTAINPASSDHLQYNVSTTFGLGAQSAFVECIFEGSNNTFDTETANSYFIVDTTAPPDGTVSVPVNTTQSSRIRNVRFQFSDNESGISLYEYVVGSEPYGQTGWNDTLNITPTTSSITDIYIPAGLVVGNSYYVSARATNGAGEKSADWVSSNATTVVFSSQASGGNNSVIIPMVNITLPPGTTVSYPDGSRVTLPNGTRITIPASLAGQFNAGSAITLPAGTTLILPTGATQTLPANAVVTLPAAVVSADQSVVTKGTDNPTSNVKNQTNQKPAAKPADTQAPLNYPSAFSAGLLIFCLALLIVGGGAGYLVYANKKQKGKSAASLAAQLSSGFGDDDVVVPSGPPSVHDKLKSALQSRIRKQHVGGVSNKASHLFSTFGTEGTSSSGSSSSSGIKIPKFEPRIGVTKIKSNNASESSAASVASSSSSLSASSSTSSSASSSRPILPNTSVSLSDASGTLRRTQESLDRLKSIANKQRSIGQLRRSTKSGNTNGSGSISSGSQNIDRLKNLRKK